MFSLLIYLLRKRKKHHHELQIHFPLESSFLYLIAFRSDFATRYIKSFQKECKQWLGLEHMNTTGSKSLYWAIPRWMAVLHSKSLPSIFWQAHQEMKSTYPQGPRETLPPRGKHQLHPHDNLSSRAIILCVYIQWDNILRYYPSWFVYFFWDLWPDSPPPTQLRQWNSTFTALRREYLKRTQGSTSSIYSTSIVSTNFYWAPSACHCPMSWKQSFIFIALYILVGKSQQTNKYFQKDQQMKMLWRKIKLGNRIKDRRAGGKLIW